MLQVFLPGILTSPAGGTIVTLSSVLGHLTAAGLADYTATKAAMSAVHRTLDAELRLSGAQDKVKLLLAETGQVGTQLVERIKTPNRFLAPVLEPVQVAREIVSIVDSGNGGLLRLPAYASLVSWYAVLPASIQRLARYMSGIDTAMWRATFSDEWDKNPQGRKEVSGGRSAAESEVGSVDSDE
jgi:short-subunit dehydrogenase